MKQILLFFTQWWRWFSVYNRNAKILNLLENQNIIIYQHHSGDNGKHLALAIRRQDASLMSLDPYRTLDTTYEGLAPLNMWVQSERKACVDMSISERLYTLLQYNKILNADSEVEIKLDDPRFEIAHLYFA